jgi:uncharacterized protein (DUF2345 family)
MLRRNKASVVIQMPSGCPSKEMFMKYGKGLRKLRTTLLALILVPNAWAQGQPHVAVNPWMQLAEITASDGMLGNEFGYSVATSGDTTVVGAPMYGVSDAAYVFVKPASGWTNATQTAKLTPSDGIAATDFGESVAISGNTIVVGAAYEGATNEGAVYIFVEPSSGWTDMTETAKLTASDQNSQYFGYSVGISGDTVVAGYPGESDFQGAAYVFVKPEGGWVNMTETAKLTASDGATGAYLGASVAVSGDTIVLGAPEATVDKVKLLGAAYVFVKPSGGWINMNQTAKLTSGGYRQTDAELGLSVAIDRNTVVAGKPFWEKGEACVFVEPPGGWSNMTETARLSFGKGGRSRLGFSVAVSGNTIVAGAPESRDQRGVVYAFIKPPSGWKTTSKIRAKLAGVPGTKHGQLGYSVSVHGKTAVAGGPGTYPYTSPGLAYIFGH